MEEHTIKRETADLYIVKDKQNILCVQFDFINGIDDSDGICGAYGFPTQSLLQRWIRDIHGIHIIIIPTVTSSWTYKTVSVISQRDDDVINGIKSVSDLPPYKEVCGYDFNTFEDALEDALFESLKLV